MKFFFSNIKPTSFQQENQITKIVCFIFCLEKKKRRKLTTFTIKVVDHVIEESCNGIVDVSAVNRTGDDVFNGFCAAFAKISVANHG